MRPAYAITILVASIFASGCASQPNPAVPPPPASADRPVLPAELETYLDHFTGIDVLDCGTHALRRADGVMVSPTDQDLQRSSECAVRAAGSRRPFRTYRQDPGTDSLVGHGLVGTAKGTIYRFTYDSAPCGGSGCSGSITFRQCLGPISVTPRPWPTYYCPTMRVPPGDR